MTMLRTKKISKTYGKAHTALTVLSDVDFEYQQGEVVGVYGSSGSGKSTFLHIIGGLDRPTSGQVLLDDKDLYSRSEESLAEYRNRTIGFVFQFYHLLPEFSAEENVMMPCLIAGISKKESKERALAALSKVGLYDRRAHRPSQLSGGEQQRTALSRAIVMGPKLLLADEPTGNLDKVTGLEIMKVLLDLNKKEGMGIVMVTHDISLAGQMDRKLEIRDGRLMSDR